MEKLRIAMRGIIAAWFIVINLFILVPSYQVLSDDPSKTEGAMSPPSPPGPLMLPQLDPTLPPEVQKEQVGGFTQQVNAYAQQVSAYTQEVNAYKAFIESAAKSDRLSKYNAVITESLVPLLNAFIVTFLGWVFANVAAGAAERFTELRRSRIESVVTAERKPLEPIRLL